MKLAVTINQLSIRHSGKLEFLVSGFWFLIGSKFHIYFTIA